MSVRARKSAAVAAGLVMAAAAMPATAYAGGTPAPHASAKARSSAEPAPVQGRTEGGSIILTSGDIVACAGVGDLRIAGADGREHLTNGPGTHFTTPAGTDVLTLRTGLVRVTAKGASADIECGPEQFPTLVTLPKTGPGDDTALLAIVGLGLVATGAVTVAATTRRPRRRDI